MSVNVGGDGLRARFWVTAKGLRLLGISVPESVADEEPVLPVEEVVLP